MSLEQDGVQRGLHNVVQIGPGARKMWAVKRSEFVFIYTRHRFVYIYACIVCDFLCCYRVSVNKDLYIKPVSFATFAPRLYVSQKATHQTWNWVTFCDPAIQ